MVSELGLIYTVGRHWTGSMIELGYGHNEQLTFNSNDPNEWMETLDESILSCLTCRNNDDGGDSRRRILASKLILERFLESNRCVLPSSIVRYLLELIKQKAGCRHSLTSLLPTEIQDSSPCSISYETRHRKKRCRSCEPQTKTSHFRNSSVYSFIIEKLLLSRRQEPTLPLSTPRKRLSLSDSEICYAKELVESKEEKRDAVDTHDDKELDKELLADYGDVVDSKQEAQTEEHTTDQTPGTDNENNDKVLENDSSDFSPSVKDSEGSSAEATPVEPPVKPKKKKSVRFADDVGCALQQELLITDTSLPPTLHFGRTFSLDDDYRDIDFDDSLPGVTKLAFKTLSQKRSSLPDITKGPPPVPRLVHSNSSSETLNLKVLRSPLSIGSPTNGPANWRITFTQPAAQYLAFRQRLESLYVSLENIFMSSPKDGDGNLHFYGTIKVKNITFEKQVKLRVTWDKWATHMDYPAVHNAQLNDGNKTMPYDVFMFNFTADVTKMPEPKEIQFAVCFQAGPNGSAGEYWDNNDGCNYVVIEQPSTDISPPVVKKEFFHNHPPGGTGRSPMRTVVGGNESINLYSSPPESAYTLDYRPNFNSFSSLTNYSSWQHYSSEAMYY